MEKSVTKNLILSLCRKIDYSPPNHKSPVFLEIVYIRLNRQQNIGKNVFVKNIGMLQTVSVNSVWHGHGRVKSQQNLFGKGLQYSDVYITCWGKP